MRAVLAARATAATLTGRRARSPASQGSRGRARSWRRWALAPEDQQGTQAALALLGDAARAALARAVVLARRQPEPGGKAAAGAEGLGIRHRRQNRAGDDRTRPGNRHQPARRRMAPRRPDDRPLQGRPGPPRAAQGRAVGVERPARSAPGSPGRHAPARGSPLGREAAPSARARPSRPAAPPRRTRQRPRASALPAMVRWRTSNPRLLRTDSTACCAGLFTATKRMLGPRRSPRRRGRRSCRASRNTDRMKSRPIGPCAASFVMPGLDRAPDVRTPGQARG